MTKKKTVEFNLIPFDSSNIPKNCSISVFCSLDLQYLNISFLLKYPLANLIIPGFASAKAARKNNLWEHTCFEIFIGEKEKEQYREFNLSPSGAWNVYRFSGYREGMAEEAYIQALPSYVKILSDHDFRLDVTVDLNSIEISHDFEIGFSAVLERKDMSKNYWALRHPKNTPDFHAKEGWVGYSNK